MEKGIIMKLKKVISQIKSSAWAIFAFYLPLDIFPYSHFAYQKLTAAVIVTREDKSSLRTPKKNSTLAILV